jgi:hypothetical protein
VRGRKVSATENLADRLAALKPGSRQSAARIGKDGDRGNNQNYRDDYSTAAINLLRSRDLVIVIENNGHQNFDQRKENGQIADQKEKEC